MYNLYKSGIFTGLFFLVVFFSSTTPAIAQDSLPGKLYLKYSLAKHDTDKVTILNDLFKFYQDSDPEKAFEYSKQALELSKNSSFQKGIGSSLNNIGLYYFNQGENEKALDYYIKANNVFENAANKKGSAICLANIGYLFFMQDNYVKAIDYYSQSIKAASIAGDTSRVASLLENIGIIYYNQGYYAKASDMYFKSLRLREKLNDKQGIANVLGNIGMIYDEQGNQTKSLEYYIRSLKLRQEIDDKQGIANSLTNIGTLYQNSFNYKKALEYFSQALTINLEINYKTGIAISYLNIGNVHKLTFDYSKALEYFNKANAIYRDSENKSGLASTLFEIAEVYSLKGDKTNALASYKKSVEYSDSTGIKDLLKLNYKSIAEIYSGLNDYKNAFYFLNLYSNIKDSIYSEETINQMVDIQAKYETEKQLEEINLLTKETELKDIKLNRGKILFIFILSFSIISVIFVLIILRAYRNKKQINKILTTQNNQILAQQKLLSEKKKELENEKSVSEGLLLNILPYETAEELKAYGAASVKTFENVTVMFTDFVGFTTITEKITPDKLIHDLNTFFIRFDEITSKYGIEKIKTIGDAYMCVSGMPIVDKSGAKKIILAAFEMHHFVNEENQKKIKNNELPWKIRIGLHTGEIIAGVVGKKKFAYDIWGDTVNIASRIESSCEEGKINISETTYELISSFFECTHRGKIAVKNKSDIDMYYVERIKPEKSIRQEGFFPLNQ